MKKLIATLLSFCLVFSLLACTPSDEPQPQQTASDLDPSTELTLDSIKIGFVHIADPSDQGYTYNHNKGTEKMVAELGLREDQVINKFNIPETSECESALRELVEQGCNIIFATTFAYEQFVLTVAAEHPEVEFCHASGHQAAESGLPNMHNYYGSVYQARYLSGIVAGLKTTTNKLGYVAAQPYADCIAGYSGYYLGAKSVNPDVEMIVKYTYSWNDPRKESQLAQSLIDMGCDVIAQHADSTACATTAQANGVYHIGYNADMRDAAPDASLTSAIWDWSVYLKYAVETLVSGDKIPVDWSQGLAEGVVDISPLNEDLIAAGTTEAVEEARDRIVNTDWDVFTGPLYNSDGELIVEEGETFVEPASAPSWSHILEGVEIFDE